MPLAMRNYLDNSFYKSHQDRISCTMHTFNKLTLILVKRTELFRVDINFKLSFFSRQPVFDLALQSIHQIDIEFTHFALNCDSVLKRKLAKLYHVSFDWQIIRNFQADIIFSEINWSPSNK